MIGRRPQPDSWWRRLASLPSKQMHNLESKTFVVFENSRMSRIWRHILLIWAVFSLIITPIQFCTLGISNTVKILDPLFQIIFWLDCALLLATALKEERNTCLSSTWMWVILSSLSCLPWEIISTVSGQSVRWCLWLRLSRLRILDMSFRLWQQDTRISHMGASLLRSVMSLAYTTHVATCLFLYLAVDYAENWYSNASSNGSFKNLTFGKRFLTSWYFVTIIMSTIGFGDFHASNGREMAAVIVLTSVSQVLSSYIIGEIVTYLSKKSSSMKTEVFRGEMEALENYLELNNVHQEVKKRCKEQLQLLHQWDIQQSKGEEVLGRLPSALQAKVFEARMEDLKNNDYFSQFSQEALTKIALKAKVEVYLHGDELRASLYSYMLLSGDVTKESRINEVKKWDLLMGDDEIWSIWGPSKVLSIPKSLLHKAYMDSVEKVISVYKKASLLHAAVMQGDKEAVEWLYSRVSARPQVEQHDGVTPYLLAAWHDHKEILEYFHEEQHIHPRTLGKYASAVLERATEKGWNKLVKDLCNHGVCEIVHVTRLSHAAQELIIQS